MDIEEAKESLVEYGEAKAEEKSIKKKIDQEGIVILGYLVESGTKTVTTTSRDGKHKYQATLVEPTETIIDHDELKKLLPDDVRRKVYRRNLVPEVVIPAHYEVNFDEDALAAYIQRLPAKEVKKIAALTQEVPTKAAHIRFTPTEL